MKKPRELGEIRRLDLYPRLKECPVCGHRLVVAFRKQRVVVGLRETLAVVTHAVRCGYGGCVLAPGAIKPEEEGGLALPAHTFGLDVVAWIGRQRFQQSRPIPAIHAALQQEYRLAISLREVEYLAEEYLALVQTVVARDPALLADLRCQGRLLLALDGVRPENGNTTLFLLRDVLSGRVLVARDLLSAATGELVGLLNEVKALGIPIAGVVSDKQESILLAVAQALPGVPHQICQFHYLRDALQPIVDLDRALCKELRIGVRGIRDVERAVDRGSTSHRPLTAGQADVLRDLCIAIRTVVGRDGHYPLKPRGIALFEDLQAIQATIQTLQQAGDHPLLQRLTTLLRHVPTFQTRYDEVAAAYDVVRDLCHLLTADDGRLTKDQAQAQLTACVDRQLANDALPTAWPAHLAKLTRAFLPGLFAFLDVPDLPRTNNDLETFIGSTKAAARKMTGHKNVQQFILRQGAAVAILRGLPRTLDLGQRFYDVPYHAWRDNLNQLRKRTRRAKEFLAKRNLKKLLALTIPAWFFELASLRIPA